MKRATVAAAGVASAVLLLSLIVAAAPPVQAEAPTVASLARLKERSLRWGLSHQEVTDLYNLPGGLFDREYAPRIARLEPGVKMQELEADKDSRKMNFERSFAVFGDSPSGYDMGPFHSEYTHNNDEGIQRLFKDGKSRAFFYIKDRLWKVYDEVPLRAGGPWGTSYESAIASLTALLGVPGRVRTPDGSPGLERTTTDWQDAVTHLRAIDRSNEHIVGIVLVDKSTLSRLASLRSNHPADPFALDPSITAITRGGVSDPNARRGAADAGPSRGRRH